MRYRNSSYFLEVNDDSIHLKIVNNTFYLVGDPLLIPSIVFAPFREDPLYVKVGHCIMLTVHDGHVLNQYPLSAPGVCTLAEPVVQHHPTPGLAYHHQYCGV